ncbi:hypothetical protein Csa_017016 [Cucumis sativus]|uniref:Uncharacterized protein n=1 Tax=Cucumis sativus TaxID=3659 RepID=A0A0A0KHG0_CUCSA|nr:hypothetical protein Csa_017016 [Cucumis sativus]
MTLKTETSAQTELPTLQKVYSIRLLEEACKERNMIAPDSSLPSINLTAQLKTQKDASNFSSESLCSYHPSFRGRGNQNNHVMDTFFIETGIITAGRNCQICGHLVTQLFGVTILIMGYQNGNNFTS